MTHNMIHQSNSVEQIKADLQAILDGIKEGIFVITRDFVINRVNEAQLELLGRDTFQSVIGKNCYQELFKKNSVCPNCPAKETFKTGRVSFIRKNYLRQDGKRFILDIFTYPLKNDLGEVERIVVCAKDVTVKDKYERSLRERLHRLITEKKLLQQDKIGRFAASLAHEIRSPLDFIISKIDYLLIEKFNEDKLSDFLDDLKKIRDYTYYIAEITDGLLNFFNKNQRDFSPVEVNSILMNAVNLAKQRQGDKNIRFQLQLDPDLLKIMGSSICLERCFLNILNNAIDAIPEEGSIKIKTTRSPESQDMIQVVISDTGMGISKKEIGKVFDPFYTTKKGRKGRGLGLALSHWIIEEHKGTIKVTSQVGKGTTFVISLPIMLN